MENNQKILIDDELDADLLKKGYVVVPFLAKEEVENLTSFFYENHPAIKEGLSASSHSPDPSFRQRISDGIKDSFLPSINNYFFECAPLGGSYIIKGPGEKGTLNPHQDWNIVDENNFRSFNIWVPLVDVDESNGAVLVLPSSHAKSPFIRGINIPNKFQNVFPLAWDNMEILRMKAGEALIYDHRLIHASRPNNNSEPRIAVVYGIASEQAAIRYYYRRENHIEEYSCPPEFYLTGNPAMGPGANKMIQKIPYNFSPINQKEFTEVYLKNNNKANFSERVLSVFSNILNKVKAVQS
jgi:hypothetical protein